MGPLVQSPPWLGLGSRLANRKGDRPAAGARSAAEEQRQGRTGGGRPEAELVARYEQRIAWPIKITELPESGGRVSDPATPYRSVLLDERGRDLTSREFAAILERWRDEGVREARFVLGAADGHSHEERQQADLLLAFGRATWPHLFARAMLAEQLYRATTIVAGHPYHRD